MASYAFEQAIAHLEAQAARDKTSSNPFGISRDMFETWRGRSVTLVALRDISKDEARRIYELHYWRAFEGDELPPALAIMVMDAATQTGVKDAVKTLQKSYNSAIPNGMLRVDGMVGPNTLRALRSVPTATVLNEYIVQRGGAMAVVETVRNRNLNWVRRLVEASRLAHGMLGPRTGRGRPTDTVATVTLPAGVDVQRHFFFQKGSGVSCYGSFFQLWGGWATAAHVMEDMLFVNPPFITGDQLHRPGGMDVTLIGARLPAEQPPAPSKGQRLIIAGYPWGSHHVEIRKCEALYEMDHKDLRTGSHNAFWTARIHEPAEPVVRGMSGGAVFDEETGQLMGVLTTANHAADFDRDGDSDQSCDFVSLNRIWAQAARMVAMS